MGVLMKSDKPELKTSHSSDNREIVADATQCSGCLTCMLRCSFHKGGEFNLSRSKIKVRKLVGAENEFEITFTQDCDACGVCAVYCPYGALIRHKVKEKV